MEHWQLYQQFLYGALAALLAVLTWSTDVEHWQFHQLVFDGALEVPPTVLEWSTGSSITSSYIEY
jgi:hypothetical protein